jgi:flagellin-like hook-associated protein FlgL
MFQLKNTLEQGYSAHMVLNRPYSRTHEAFKALDVTDQSKNTSAEVVIHNLLQGNTAAQGRVIYNANTTISMLQTFDLAVNSIADVLSQMSKLADQAATDVYSEPELAVMQDQFGDLVDQVKETADETNYEDYYLLKSDTNAVTIYIANGHSVNVKSQNLAFTGATDLTEKAKEVVTAVDEAQSAVESYDAYLKAEIDLLKQQLAMAQAEIARQMDYGLHVPNGAFAQELAHEVMGDISGKRVLALWAQSNVNPTQLMLGRKNPKQPYIHQYGDTA